MKLKLYFFLVFSVFHFAGIGQTTSLPYHKYAYTGGYASVTLSNFSTCQVGAFLQTNSQGYNGSNNWSNKNYSIIINGTNIGTYIGTQTIDVSAYLPINTVQMSSSHGTWSWVDLTVNITSNNTSMPASGPTVISPTKYGQGQSASPLTANLTGSGTSLKWYTSANGDNYSATASTPNTSTLGTTSYWVAQADASGCESVRSKIDVVVVGPANHLNFDGINDNVTIPATTLNNLQQGTIETWVYPTAGVLNNQTICAKQSDFENSYAVFSIGGGSASTGKLFYQSKNGTSIVSNTTIATNQWTHIAVTFSATQAKLYINGVLDATVSGDFSLPDDTTVTGTAIGAWPASGGGQYFSGGIDDFRVWNVERSEFDIARSKYCELQGNEAGLMTYYKCNQGYDAGTFNSTFNSLTETTSNANHGTLNNFALMGSVSNWLAGSPVVRGSVIPGAPVANNQIHCTGNNPKVANLNPAPSSTIKWYDVATGGTTLATNTALASGTYYVASLNANGCESVRTSVVVTLNPTPAEPIASTQTFCAVDNPKVSDLIATGTAIKWYNNASGGSPLSNTTVLTSGTYYATQTENGCESLTRTAINVNVYAYPPTVNLTSQVFVSDITVSSLVATGNNLKWYDVPSGGTALANTTVLIDNQTYYVTQSENGCESARVSVTAKKISNVSQSFCSTATVGDLVSTPSSGSFVKWYTNAIGGTPLANSTPLAVGNYYIEQNTPTVQVSNVGTGFNQPYGIVVQPDGKILVADYNNNEIKRMNPDGTGIVSLGTGFNNPYGLAIQPDGKIIVGDYGNGAIKRMEADGTGIVTLATGVYPIYIKVQADGKILFSDQGSTDMKRMNSDGTGIVSLYTSSSGFLCPFGIAVQNDGKILIADSYGNGIVRINADGTGLVNLIPSDSYSVVVQPDGKILYNDWNGLTRVNADGSNPVLITNTISYQVDMAIEADGHILTTDGSTNVKRINEFYAYDRLPVNVTIDTMPADGITQNLGTLTASQNGATYQWYECPNTLLTGENNQSFTPSVAGDYKVVVTNGSCSVTSSCETVTALNTSDFEVKANVKLYPNPIQNEFNVDIHNLTNVSLEVFDINGRILKIQKLGVAKNKIEVNDLPSGLYMFKITSNEGTTTSKVVKQ